MPCFICKETGAKCCDGHCGLCAEFEDRPEPGGKPSERDYADETD